MQVVIGSDSGSISVVEFNVAKNQFVKAHCEVFGKTGCRRAVPGQYVACDPRGRAIMAPHPRHFENLKSGVNVFQNST